MIRKEGGKYVVKTHSGKRKLGTHKTKVKARKQLAAIEISKAKRKVKRKMSY